MRTREPDLQSRCRRLAEQVECRDAPDERHEVVGRPANKADLQGLVFQPDANDDLGRIPSGCPLPSVAHWSRAPFSATTTTAAAPASFSVAVAVAMADQSSVMCRVLSLHFLVCLSVRLSFLFPSFSLPFLVSPSSSTTFSLHLFNCSRGCPPHLSPSSGAPRQRSVKDASPPWLFPRRHLSTSRFNAQLHCALLAPVAAHHLPLEHCSPSRFPLSLLSAVHCSPHAAPPPEAPLPLLPDPRSLYA